MRREELSISSRIRPHPSKPQLQRAWPSPNRTTGCRINLNHETSRDIETHAIAGIFCEMLPFGMKLFGKPHTTFPHCIGFSIFVLLKQSLTVEPWLTWTFLNRPGSLRVCNPAFVFAYWNCRHAVPRLATGPILNSVINLLLGPYVLGPWNF